MCVPHKWPMMFSNINFRMRLSRSPVFVSLEFKMSEKWRAAFCKNYPFSLLHCGSSPILPLTYGSICIECFVLGSKRCIFSAIKCVSTIQGHARSMILVPIESAYGTSCRSVIVTVGLIISDMLQVFGWKLQIFPTLLSCGAPLRVFYSKLRGEVYHEKN